MLWGPNSRRPVGTIPGVSPYLQRESWVLYTHSTSYIFKVNVFCGTLHSTDSFLNTVRVLRDTAVPHPCRL